MRTSIQPPWSFSPCERELELALARAPRAGRLGLPRAAVPEHDGAAAVLALGDDAFEAAVLERVVLDLHREALVRRVEARPLGHGPALQDAVELQAEVVVQAAGGVLLDDEATSRCAVPARREVRPGSGVLPKVAFFGRSTSCRDMVWVYRVRIKKERGLPSPARNITPGVGG